jgi:hypothetical protein
LVLAYGEATGHAHVIADERAELVTSAEAEELYLAVYGDEAVALTHDEHDTIAVGPGFYRVVRQREYIPGVYEEAGRPRQPQEEEEFGWDYVND